MKIFKYMLKNDIEKKNDETVEEESKNKDKIKIYEDSKEKEKDEEDNGDNIKTDMIEEKKEIEANEIIKLFFFRKIKF